MKPYAFFIGCQIPARIPQYESASRAVLERLGVELKDYPLFNCCGYPMRNASATAFVLSAARNIALAEDAGLDMLVLCKCCFGSLKAAEHLLEKDAALKEEINAHLKKHDLRYSGTIQIRHLLSVLFHDVGLDAIRKQVLQLFENLNIAAHTGCHALRPSKVTRFDNPISPVVFDSLVELTGARPVRWEAALECCGAPLTGVNDSLSGDLTTKKLDSAKGAGAGFLCTACPYCQLQFDTVQEILMSERKRPRALPSILYPQLLGICMGIDDGKLGLGMNRIDLQAIRTHLQKE
jgi:heterodisulfide reductase subunit B